MAPAGAWRVAAIVASVVPALVAYDLLPWPRQIRQCLAVALWGVFLLALRPRWLRPAGGVAPDAALQAALALLATAAWASSAFGHLPWSLAGQAVGVLLAAMAMARAGVATARRADADAVWMAVATGLVAAGLANVGVALVQVFAPAWVGNPLLVQPAVPGRASGNLGQSNHLASLLLWAVVGAAALFRGGLLARRGLALALVALALGLALSASRIGALGLLVLAAWGLWDRRLPPTLRRLLGVLPLVYGAAVLALFLVGQWQSAGWGLAARVLDDSAAPSTNSRLHIWHNTLALIAAEPLRGVGFGEFNLAWTLTDFPVKPVALFDHCHNLPLQLLVELGLPLGGLVLGLLALAAVQAVRRARTADGRGTPAATEALLLVALIGLHSQLEYPLWYAYFLLPAAFAWGFALGDGGAGPSATAVASAPRWPGDATLALAGLAMAVGGALALGDYFRAAAVWEPVAGGAPARVARLAQARHSPLFAHHADAVAALGDVPAEMQAQALVRAPHKLLDARLLSAWAQWLDARGRHDLACVLWARARHFGPVEGAPADACPATVGDPGWRAFVAATAERVPAR